MLFLDSDDMITAGIIRKMVNSAEERNLEFLRCNTKTIFDNPALAEKFSGFQYKHDYPGIYKGLDLYLEMKKNREFTTSACRGSLPAVIHRAISHQIYKPDP